MNSKTNLMGIHPDLMKEWDFEKNKGIDPQSLSESSKRIVSWRCSEGHEWRAPVVSRVRKMGCPICSRKLRMKCNNLSATPAELCSEWKQEEVSSHELMVHPVGSTQNVWWKAADGRVNRMPSDISKNTSSDEVQSNA